MADISYDRVNWVNEPSHNTPLSAQNLNKMDTAIDELVEKSNSLKPNPTGTPTEGLEKLEYDGTVYEVKGGHKVLDDSGTLLTQKDNLQFKGVYSHNVGDNSEVDIVREFQSKSAIEALTGEEAKGFQYLDDDVYDAFTASDIGFDNSDTSFTGTDVQEVLEEVDSKIDEVDLTNGGTVDGSLAVGKSTSADTYLAVGSPTSKGILNLTNNNMVVGIEADTLTANRAIKVPNNSGTIALTNNLSVGIIGTGNKILSKFSDSSIPIGVSVWGTQNAEDSPQKGTVSYTFMMKATYGGLYSSAYMFVNGSIYFTQTGSSLPSSLSWSRIV